MAKPPDGLKREYQLEDVDHNSGLLIQLSIETASPPHDGPELFSNMAENTTININSGVFQTPGLLTDDTTQLPRSRDPGFFDTTREQVLNMPMLQLEQFRRRIQQLEVSNYGLLKKIYGDSVDPNFLLSFSDGNLLLELDFGSFQYRESLFEQYRKMMNLARHPEIGGTVPSTSEGTNLLQEYMTQLITIAQQQHDHIRVAGYSDHALLHRPGRPSAPRFRIDKHGPRGHKHQMGSFDTGMRSPIRGNSALIDYQRQLSILEQENQQRIAMTDPDIPMIPRSIDFDLLGYEQQLEILRLRNERRLRATHEHVPPQLNDVPELDRPALYSEPSSASSTSSGRPASLSEVSPPPSKSSTGGRRPLKLSIPKRDCDGQE